MKTRNQVKTFNKKMLSTLVITSLISSSALASSNIEQELPENEFSEQDKRETIGFGMGAFIGAVFGGPAGAFITGIAGNFLAKNINDTEEISELELTLIEEKTKHQQHVAMFQQKLQHSEQAYQNELLALEQNYRDLGQVQAENLLMSLQFSTGSSKIAPHYDEQVSALAQLLQSSPNMKIDLSGYTDLQGDEKANHNLSLARVNSVKNALINQGVASDRIQTFAFGETEPVVANAQKEVSFYDRRVVVKLHQDSNQMANNH